MKLTPKQSEIIKKILGESDVEYLILGGFGSGKTYLLSLLALIIARLPKMKILIARETIREIVNTIIPTILELADEDERKAMEKEHNQNNQVIVHPSGSQIFYLSLSKEGEQFRKIRSYEFNMALIDEASEISEDAYEEVKLRVRRPQLQKIVLFSNPTSYDHWLYKKFAGKEIRMSSFDNPYLPKHYLQYLMNFPAEIRKVLADGEWGIAKKNEVYDFSEENIIKENLDISFIEPENLFFSIDFGIENTAIVGGFFTGEQLIIFYEKFHQNTPLPRIIDEIIEEFKRKGIDIRKANWTGDIAGSQRTFEGISPFDFLQQKYNIFVRTKKYDLISSVALENFLLKEKIEVEEIKNGKIIKKKEPKILVHINCSKVISSYYSAYKIEKDKIKKDNYLEHIKDATRYLINHVFSHTHSKILSYAYVYR